MSGDIDIKTIENTVCEQAKVANQSCLPFKISEYNNNSANCFNDFGTNRNTPFCDAAVVVLPENLLIDSDFNCFAKISNGGILFKRKEEIEAKINDANLSWTVASIENTTEAIKEAKVSITNKLHNQIFSILVLSLSVICLIWASVSIYVHRFKRQLFIQITNGWKFEKYINILGETLSTFAFSVILASLYTHSVLLVFSAIFTWALVFLCTVAFLKYKDQRLTNIVLKMK
jgi:hypothetical protein